MGIILHLSKVFLEKKKYGVPPTIRLRHPEWIINRLCLNGFGGLWAAPGTVPIFFIFYSTFAMATLYNRLKSHFGKLAGG